MRHTVRPRRRQPAIAAALLVAAAFSPSAASATCSGDVGSGDWPMYGHDLEGSRHQTAEDVIAPANVGSLRLAWRVPGANASTPIVAGGCVYVAGGTILANVATVRAYDLQTGTLVWTSPVAAPDGESGTSIHAVAVADGRVHLNAEFPSAEGGRAFAFDAATGDLLWRSELIEFGFRAQVISSAMVFEGVHWLETYGPDGDPRARPGYAAFDAVTGETLHEQTTVPPADLDTGYASGGMWGTPVFDAQGGYLFNGTANAYAERFEHEYDNALIKIDAARGRGSFGSVVDHYKGSPDNYILPSTRDSVVCEEFTTSSFWDPACTRLDLDFVSPQLFRNSSGRLLVGAIQRDGYYHVADAATMDPEWKTLVSNVDIVGNEAAGANDGENIYVLTNKGPLFALAIDTGMPRWVSWAPEAEAYHPLALANGVLFAPAAGSLTAYDASNGAPLWHTNLELDGEELCVNLGGGVALAHHTVIVNCDGGQIFAYRLDPDASPAPVGARP